ncbi:hypothetical protein KCP73_18880 [Salmonella enterica subsp. enterica]|nr:hypothetical protein KCP73_18880 [Salmonella enterica subsp. enterica]
MVFSACAKRLDSHQALCMRWRQHHFLTFTARMTTIVSDPAITLTECRQPQRFAVGREAPVNPKPCL